MSRRPIAEGMPMNRRDTTEELSELVRKKLANLTPCWASEVPVDGGALGSGIVDFMAFKPATRGYPVMCEAELERGLFYFVEVKSCLADFKSGHGLNFNGDQNWLVCERDLADELREKRMLPQNCTIFVPDAPRKRLLQYITLTPERAQRDHSVAFLLYQMMRRGIGS